MSKRALASARFAIFIFCLSCCLTIAAADTGAEIQGGLKRLRSPMRITVNPDDDLVVSDFQKGRIYTFDKDTMQLVRLFPVAGKPLAVGCYDRRVLVGNTTMGTIDVFKRNGRMLYSFATEVQWPSDMALDAARDRVFVVDSKQKAVVIFDLVGNFRMKIPAVPPDNSLLAAPSAIALDTTAKRVYVSDYGDQANSIYPRIQIFKYDGRLVSTISGKIGMFGTRFSRPQGLAVDGRGRLYMLDYLSAEILVFDGYSGTLIKTFGEYGEAPGQLRRPVDLVLDVITKKVFITNNGYSPIEVLTK